MNIGRILAIIIKVAPVVLDAVKAARKKKRQPVPRGGRGVKGDNRRQQPNARSTAAAMLSFM